MGFFASTKLTLPTAAQALPGRAEALPVPERHFVTRNPLRPPFPAGLERAVLGLGCFWGAERRFWQTPGVYTTAAGYAGGFTANPTYEEVCSGRTGHAEVVLVVFDPAVLSYEALLRVFWEAHDPTQRMRQGHDVGTSTARSSSPAEPTRLRRPRRPVRCTSGPLTGPGSAPSPRRSRLPAPSTTPRATTSSTSPRIRPVTVGWGARGWRVPRA